MAHIVDITSFLDSAHPKIKIGENEYVVNDEKSVVLKVQKLLTGESEDGFGMQEFEKAVELLLSKDGFAHFKETYPEALDSISKAQVLMTGIMASIQGLTYEQAQERFL